MSKKCWCDMDKPLFPTAALELQVHSCVTQNGEQQIRTSIGHDKLWTSRQLTLELNAQISRKSSTVYSVLQQCVYRHELTEYGLQSSLLRTFITARPRRTLLKCEIISERSTSAPLLRTVRAISLCPSTKWGYLNNLRPLK